MSGNVNTNAFLLVLCKDGYVPYTYTDLRICLKYVPDLVRYTQARALCKADGADLIRMDTTLKFDLFKEFLGMSISELGNKYSLDRLY